MVKFVTCHPVSNFVVDSEVILLYLCYDTVSCLVAAVIILLAASDSLSLCGYNQLI
jgi:hypothetical protein